MRNNVSIINVEKTWDLKIHAYNNIFNYLEAKGFDENERLEFVELLNQFSASIIKLNN